MTNRLPRLGYWLVLAAPVVAVIVGTTSASEDVSKSGQIADVCRSGNGGETCETSPVRPAERQGEATDGIDATADATSAETKDVPTGPDNKEGDDDDVDRDTFLGNDRHVECATWAREVDDETGLGRCQSDRPFMLSECAESCLSVAGVSVLMLLDEDLIEDAIKGYGYLIAEEYDDDDEECKDTREECDDWSEEAECMDNPSFMLAECEKSCRVCFEPGVQSIRIGVEQRVEFYGSDKLRDLTIDVIRHTLQYMVEEVMVDEKFIPARRDCFNHDPKCSYWAAQGRCDGDDERWMAQHCSPACQYCLSVEYWHRCGVDHENPLHNDIMKKGDLNTMFQRIMEAEEFSGFNPVALSQPDHLGEKGSQAAEKPREGIDYIVGPWVILLDPFLSEEESEHLITLGHGMEFERSTEVSDTEKNEDGSYRDDISSEGRTSTTAWCSDECYDDPVVTRIHGRIVNLTGVPKDNYEHFQLLKYETEQFYEEHHDYITSQQYSIAGPRILTVFLYLNDVEEGGETTFPRLNLTVTPKRGAALIWPSVLDEEPDEIDERTFHMAMPVKQGMKFGANAWLHLRNYEAASEVDCS